jgi:uncharacterized membrane protein YidH (DUF202 family)
MNALTRLLFGLFLVSIGLTTAWRGASDYLFVTRRFLGATRPPVSQGASSSFHLALLILGAILLAAGGFLLYQSWRQQKRSPARDTATDELLSHLRPKKD